MRKNIYSVYSQILRIIFGDRIWKWRKEMLKKGVQYSIIKTKQRQTNQAVLDSERRKMI